MRRKMLLLGGTGLGLCLFLGSDVLATTIRVPADRLTIQAGINATVNGDTVLVSPGTYPEHINFFGKRIVVSSTKGADSTLITRVVDGLALVSFQNSEDSTAVLKGFSLTGLTNAPECVKCYQASPRIEDNDIHGNTGTGVLIRCESSTAPIITGNLIHGNSTSYAIYLYFSAPRIQGNVLYKNVNGAAIVLQYSNYSQSPQCICENNTIVGSTGHGIWSIQSRALVEWSRIG